MNYNDYKKEDFFRDEYFQKWVLDSDSSTEEFWRHWLNEHREKWNTVDDARRMVLLFSEGMNVEKLSDDDFNTMWHKISERKENYRNGGFDWRIMVRIAAVFIGITVLSYGLFNSGILPTMEDDQPTGGSSQITLELQDGSVVPIVDGMSGVISMDGGADVATQNQHELVYSTENAGIRDTLVYNKLTVPYGKRFELVLSDGTHVILNSGSRLRYPVQFLNNAPRDVYLDGEAFCTVAKDISRPFTVHTEVLNTKVYGTEFNVSSYENDNNTFTVLIEGSVGVYGSGNRGEPDLVTLVPGQIAEYENGTIDVEMVNVDKYIAWIEGKLLFTDDRFDLILKKLERHFNIDIDNQFVKLNDRRFTGSFRDESLTQILEIFQEITPFDFVQNGNTITIKKGPNMKIVQ